MNGYKCSVLRPAPSSPPILHRWEHDWLATILGRLIDIVKGQKPVTLQDTSQPGSYGYTGQFSIDDSGRLVAGAFASNSVDLWDATTGELLRRFDVPAMAVSVALSPNGEYLASGTAWHSSIATRGKGLKESAKDRLETCFL